MNTLSNTKTAKNLIQAFAGESMARNKYEFFAKVAEKEGYKKVAKVFLETAEHERSHAKRFWKYLDGLQTEINVCFVIGKQGNTVENLKQAAQGEMEEHNEMYPLFSQIAKEEGFLEIASAFKLIAKVEIEHEKRFRKLLDEIEKQEIYSRKTTTRWICTKCGYVHEGLQALQTCPACLHPQNYFEEYYF